MELERFGLTEWMINDLSVPYFISPFQTRSINTYIHGVVGCGKTISGKSIMNTSLLRGYTGIVFDESDEYPYQKVNIKLEKEFIDLEIIEQIIGSTASYLEYIVPYFRNEITVDELKNDLDPRQQKLFYKAIKKLSLYINEGVELIDSINKYKAIRIVLDPNFAVGQLIVILQQLIKNYKLIDKGNGLIVIIEELEAISRLDPNLIIPMMIFRGRKRRIFFIVLSHTHPDDIGSEWHKATIDQMDTIIHLKEGVAYI